MMPHSRRRWRTFTIGIPSRVAVVALATIPVAIATIAPLSAFSPISFSNWTSAVVDHTGRSGIHLDCSTLATGLFQIVGNPAASDQAPHRSRGLLRTERRTPQETPSPQRPRQTGRRCRRSNPVHCDGPTIALKSTMSS